MAERNNFSFDEWKDYLKTDKDMNRRWKSLIVLWEEVSDDIKKTLEWLPKAEASSRRRELTALNIFNILNNTNQRLDFSWHKKTIWNSDDKRREYVVECYSASSDFVFKKIKEYRWVASMHWTSINRYLQPVANKIWALKEAKRVSVKTEVEPSKLSYESLKTKKTEKIAIKKDGKVSDKNVGIQASKWKGSKKKNDGQLKIEFPKDSEEDARGEPKQDVPPKTEEEELEELYKFDLDKEKYWNR